MCLGTAAVSRGGAQQWRGAWGWEGEVGWYLCLAPVSGCVQKFDAMGFRSLASTITLSVTCHQVGSMTGSVFPTGTCLGRSARATKTGGSSREKTGAFGARLVGTCLSCSSSRSVQPDGDGW